MKHQPSIVVAILVSTTLLSAQAAAQVETGQTVDAERIVDHDYGFQLDRPGPSWLLGGQRIARRYAGNALASAFNETEGIVFGLHAWPTSPTDLEGLANSLVDDLPPGDIAVEVSEAVTFAGQPAWRLQFTRWVEDTHFRITFTAIAHRDFLYLLRAAGPSDFTASDGSSFGPILSAFSFIEGDVVGRPHEAPPPNQVGVGWRVADGVYENAAFGMRVAPALASGWRLCVGDELAALNPDAEVGLLSTSSRATIIFIAEHVAGIDAEAFAEELRAIFVEEVVGVSPPITEAGDDSSGLAEGTGAATSIAMEPAIDPAVGELPVEVAGETVSLSRYQLEDAGEQMELVHGVLWHAGVAIQVAGWWPLASAETAHAQLPAAFASVGFMEEPMRQTLAGLLTVAADPQNRVSGTYSLRHGQYRDYALDYTWTKPSGFWHIASGSLARALYPEAELYVHEPSVGLTGMAIVERLGELDGPTYHAAVLEAMLAPENPALSEPPLVRQANEAEVRATWVDGKLDGFEQRFLIATTAVGERRFQMIVWGLPEMVVAHEAVVWEIVEGLEIATDDLRPSSLNDGLYLDDRMGFSLRAPSGDWTITDATYSLMAEYASFVRAESGMGQGVAVFSANASCRDQDESWFLERARETALAPLADTSFEPPVDLRFAGRPAQRLDGERDGGVVQVYLLKRGMTYFAVVAWDHTGDGPELSELVAGFELIE